MARLTILACGNSDVRDTLHSLNENGVVTWNGLNAVLRARDPGWSARVIHRTMTRSDAVLAATGMTPASLAEASFLHEPFVAQRQFDLDLFETPADVIVLSIMPDVMNELWRHLGDGHLLYPYRRESWPEPARRWLTDNYRPEPMPTAEKSMRDLERIIARLRMNRTPHVLIYNMSATMPWEQVRRYRGIAETLSERIRHFNLALIGLSRATGVSIVDVDAVLAGAGARRLKLGTHAFTAEGCRLIAEEVRQILADLGCLDPDAAA